MLGRFAASYQDSASRIHIISHADLGHDRKYSRKWNGGPGRLAEGKYLLQWTSGGCLIRVTRQGSSNLFLTFVSISVNVTFRPHILAVMLFRAKMSPKDKAEPQLLPNHSVDTLVPGPMRLPVKEESGFCAVGFFYIR